GAAAASRHGDIEEGRDRHRRLCLVIERGEVAERAVAAIAPAYERPVRADGAAMRAAGAHRDGVAEPLDLVGASAIFESAVAESSLGPAAEAVGRPVCLHDAGVLVACAHGDDVFEAR